MSLHASVYMEELPIYMYYNNYYKQEKVLGCISECMTIYCNLQTIIIIIIIAF